MSAGEGAAGGGVVEALRAAVREVEQHAAGLGWDRPASLFALVRTEELLQREPGLADVLGADPDVRPGSLTPVQQDDLPAGESLEQALLGITWPEDVYGAAAVVERLVLPPSAGDLPQDVSAAQALAETHPERQEVRIVAGATRDGATHCALRLRSHDDPLAVVESPDLVPALLELLTTTFEL